MLLFNRRCKNCETVSNPPLLFILNSSYGLFSREKKNAEMSVLHNMCGSTKGGIRTVERDVNSTNYGVHFKNAAKCYSMVKSIQYSKSPIKIHCLGLWCRSKYSKSCIHNGSMNAPREHNKGIPVSLFTNYFLKKGTKRQTARSSLFSLSCI